jgi:hypothetical protein
MIETGIFNHTRLVVAFTLAFLASELFGGIVMSALTPEPHLDDIRWWFGGIAFWSLIASVPTVILGIIPGAIMHFILNRIKMVSIIYYMLCSGIISFFSCLVLFIFVGPGNATYYVSIIVATVAATLSFWIVRRPDRSMSA